MRASTAIAILCLAAEVALSVALPLPASKSFEVPVDPVAEAGALAARTERSYNPKYYRLRDPSGKLVQTHPQQPVPLPAGHSPQNTGVPVDPVAEAGTGAARTEGPYNTGHYRLRDPSGKLVQTAGSARKKTRYNLRNKPNRQRLPASSDLPGSSSNALGSSSNHPGQPLSDDPPRQKEKEQEGLPQAIRPAEGAPHYPPGFIPSTNSPEPKPLEPLVWGDIFYPLRSSSPEEIPISP